jgi:hypothetical protein
VRKADNLTTILCRCHEVWEANFLEPSGPLQACNGSVLPLPFIFDSNNMAEARTCDVAAAIGPFKLGS